ncbi:MAG: hypothetical protein J3Q66DRAFT_386440 [Benniella sp.]|nr:MAG: hypothetical protein J3Q66DRAFT_386440 [Benniella sp.]
MWDTSTRQSAIAFLGEMYRNEDWGQDVGIKEWITIILLRVSLPSESSVQFAEALLQELGADPQQQILIQKCRGKQTSYPLKVAPPLLASPSLLDRAQNKPDVEGTLRQLRRRRLKEQGTAVYIQPQAKATLQASYDQRFPLMDKVEEFLDGNQKVFLLLGDSGAGKSTFNRHLECELWNKYKKNTGRIPLHINLPAIDKPEQDMIAKQLRKAEFTEPEIRELKVHRSFILICDGYDETQQTHNLYMSNRLNQPGEWNVQMVVSCRSEYIGVDYLDRFQPVDRNSQPGPGLFQEAVITPFTPDQVQDYIKQYVSVHQPLWEAKNYGQALDTIPGLKELVRSPLLMALSLEVLPRMVDPGEHLSVTHITRVALYDHFTEHWLERGKKRLSEKDLSPQAKAAFESLTDEGFTQNGIDFLKRLSVAIYKEQDGHPIVKYSRFKDGGSWKAEFFSREDEKQLLREACPLTRNGNQYRFIHRSLLEYGIALAVFDPNDWKEKPLATTLSERRGSTSSDYSFRSAQDVTAPIKQGLDINSPLSWRYFVDDASVLQFLCERVQQEPVFKQQLRDYIEHSKTDKKWRKAAANAITILVRAGVQFIKEDLRGIQIPGADLSFGVFESAQLQDADLRQVSFRSAWLYRADLSRAHMRGTRFGELPFLKEDNEVGTCAYSPDGRLIALSLSGGVIVLYSTSSWEQVRTLAGHEKDVNCIAFSPSGNHIISGSEDYTARLWDVEAGTCIHILNDRGIQVESVAFSPLGDTFASAHEFRVHVWDMETRRCRLSTDEVADNSAAREGSLIIVYSPQGDRIASGEKSHLESCAVHILDVETGKCLHSLRGHIDCISEVVYTSRGDRIASSGFDNTVRIWDVETGACCRILTGHDGSLFSVAFSPQGDLIASAGEDSTVRIWDTETGSCHQIFTGHSGTVSRVVFSPKGDYIASCSRDGTLRLWDIGSGGTRQMAIGHSEEILSVVYSPQGDQVVSCSYDGSIRLRDADSGVCRRTITSNLQEVANISYSLGGALVVCGPIRILQNDMQPIFIGSNLNTITAYSLERKQVASRDSGAGSMRMEDVKTKECSYTPRDYFRRDMNGNIMNSPKGIYIVSADEYNRVNIHDMEARERLHYLEGHTHEVMAAAYSPRDDLLATAGRDATVRLWSMETGKCHHILNAADCVRVVVFSAQGDQVASGGENGLMKIWDVGTGECLHTLTGHARKVTSVIFSPKGDRIVSGSEDKTIRLWDLAPGRCQPMVQVLSNYVLQIAWSTKPDVNCFVIGCKDGSEWMGQVMEDEDGNPCHIHWCWRTVSGELNLEETSVQDVRGLSHLNKQLLEQRGAKGEPSDRLREVAKNVASMVSVVSNLKQPLIGMVLETAVCNSSSEGTKESSPRGDQFRRRCHVNRRKSM